jgi:peptidoglycan hydrolase-like protein with peptidoglycan-binding domain
VATRIFKLTSLWAGAVTAAVGLALAPGAAAFANPNASLIGPGPSYPNKPTGVECVQASLGLPQDGQFGQATYDAVRDFQLDNGLSNDGIVGPDTGDLLLAQLPPDESGRCYYWVPTTYSYT